MGQAHAAGVTFQRGFPSYQMRGPSTSRRGNRDCVAQFLAWSFKCARLAGQGRCPSNQFAHPVGVHVPPPPCCDMPRRQNSGDSAKAHSFVAQLNDDRQHARIEVRHLPTPRGLQGALLY